MSDITNDVEFMLWDVGASGNEEPTKKVTLTQLASAIWGIIELVTIDELNDAEEVTEDDEIILWDAEAASGTEPTKKVTLSQLASAISSLLNISKSSVGLGNVDNTSDVDKPISTATQTALNGKQATLSATNVTFYDDSPVRTNGLTIRKYGNVVCINGYLQTNSSISTTGTMVGVVDTPGTSSATVKIPVFLGSSANEITAQAYAEITTEGEMTVTAPSNAITCKYVYFSASYIV